MAKTEGATMPDRATAGGFFHLPEWARGVRDYATATLADYQRASPEWREGWRMACVAEIKEQGAPAAIAAAARLTGLPGLTATDMQELLG